MDPYMSISFKCKCGRITTYGLKCVACSGPTFEFIGFKESEEAEEETEPEEEPNDD